jgi:hypothetical protein
MTALQVIDLQPTLWLLIFLLICLAAFMPFTGGRAARRKEAWERFDNLARIKGLLGVDRESLARWARVTLPETPHNVLVRRKDFDRFARAEVARMRGLAPPAFAFGIAQLGALRRSLGFDRSAGPAQSTHDLQVGELVDLREDDGERHLLRVLRVDEEGLTLAAVSRVRRQAFGPGWATFTRDGEGSYRFRTGPVRAGVFAHGDFLLLEERRSDPRVPLSTETFWVAVERLPDGAAPEDPEGVEVEAIDVSRGGVALLADRRVRRGSELGLDLPLGGADGPMLRGLRARVLGSGFREGGGRRPHFLHCQLVALEEPQRRVLEAFLDARVGASADEPAA